MFLRRGYYLLFDDELIHLLIAVVVPPAPSGRIERLWPQII